MTTKTKTKEALESSDLFASLPVRTQVFLAEWFANGCNATHAYKKAYPHASTPTCSIEGHRRLKDPKVVAVMREMAASREAMIVHAEKVCEEAMRARHIAATASGIIETDLPDHAIRLKAVQTVSKLKGLNAPDKVEIDVMEDTWKELLG